MSTFASKYEQVSRPGSEHPTEMVRFAGQHRLLTRAMGGALPASMGVTELHNVLDLACGTGEWVRDVAFANPRTHVLGVDINQSIINYARAQARVQWLDNASFLVTDVTRPLSLPNDSFDLVHARMLNAFLSAETWPALLRECWRVLRPGGIILITEYGRACSNSPAMNQLMVHLMQALYATGRQFAADQRDLGHLSRFQRWLGEADFKQFRYLMHDIDFSAGEPEHYNVYHNFNMLFELLKPFLIHMGEVSHEEAEQLYQQMLCDMYGSDFRGVLSFCTVWAQKPV